jgi:hypothetical protein
MIAGIVVLACCVATLAYPAHHGNYDETSEER